MHCFKLKVLFEKLPCREKLCWLKVKKKVFADEDFYRSSFFTDEYFLPTNIFWRQIDMSFFIQNFESVLFCNDFKL